MPIDPAQGIVINLGCGHRSRPGTIGIDWIQLPGVDVVANLEHGLPFADGTVDKVYANSFLEHIDHFEQLMREIHRVCKPGAEILINVPHFSNPYYYSDYTHKRFFGLYTFDYFVERKNQTLKRAVPDYYSDIRFQVVERTLKFYSPFKGRRKIKALWSKLFNLTGYLQEYWEENLSWVIPCYNIGFVLRTVKTPPAP